MHWDGKLLPELLSRSKIGKVERLPVIIVGNEIEKLLGVPKSESGKGTAMADVIYETLIDWNLADKVEAMCFGTTASNTGPYNGACHFLQQKIGRDLLPLACRHHIYEIFLRDVFELKLGKSKSPEVAIFNRFKTVRNNDDIDVTKFQSALEDAFVRSKISDEVAKKS